MIKRRLAIIVSLLVLFMGAASSAQAVDIFITADAIKGEASARSYVDKIEVSSFSFEIKSSVASGSGKGSSKINSSFRVTKKIDQSSNPILTNLVTGKALKSFVVDFVRPDGAGSDFLYLRYTFSDVVASDYSIIVDNEDEERGIETIGFIYTKISTEYFYQDRNRKVVPGPKFGFDLERKQLL